MEVSYLPEPEQHPLWPEIESLLQPATEGREVLHPADVVWIAFEGPTLFAAATSRLFDDGTAQLRLAGGCRHKEWAEQLSDTVSAWAKAAGANRLTGRGRKGWARYARAFGWDASGADDGRLLFEKDL